ncbi:MAG: PEP-CTERM sorting domain-containing protein [Planctomycetia bacterium]|nr:PEP-CTERM sorting domain-containing protein [Planctomycetia bacterium]
MRATLSARLVVLLGLTLAGGARGLEQAAHAWLPPVNPQGEVEEPPPLPNPGPLTPTPVLPPNPIDPPHKCHCECPPPPCHHTPEPSALLLGVLGAGLFGLCSLRRR